MVAKDKIKPADKAAKPLKNKVMLDAIEFNIDELKALLNSDRKGIVRLKTTLWVRSNIKKLVI